MSFSFGPLRRAQSRLFIAIPRFSRLSSTTTHHDTYLSPKLSSLVEKITVAKEPPIIHTVYPALVAELKQFQQLTPTTSTEPPLKREDVVRLLETLATSARPADLQRLDEALEDLLPVFGIPPSLDIYTTIIRAMVKQMNSHTMYRWIFSMPNRPGHFSPTVEQFNIFLEACVGTTSFKFMRNTVMNMKRVSCKPNNETFKILIRARWAIGIAEEKVPHKIVFTTLLDDMQKLFLPYDPSVAQLLYDKYAERGYPGYGEEIEALYSSRFKELHAPEEMDLFSWTLRLSSVAQRRGVNAAISLFREFQKKGCQPSNMVSRAILRHSRHLSDLQLVQRELGITVEVPHFAILVNNNVRTGHIDDAFTLFQAARTAGLIPDAPLVSPLIWSLCLPLRVSDKTLEQAVELYQFLAEHFPDGESPTVGPNGRSRGPDLEIYINLLRGLSASPNIDKHLPIAESLLADMEKRGITKEDSSIATATIVLYMKHAKTREEALQAYKKHVHLLTEKGYAIVLNVFCGLSFGKQAAIPSLQDYFEIVKDMRHAGIPITPRVYTIILHQLGKVASQIKWNDDAESYHLREQLIKTTRRTHDLLTLDASLSPDAPTWNQLMDTYQRLGCFGEAYRVWDLMYLTGRFDHVGVSIILDACGYAGAWHVAKKIWTRLFNDGFKMNLHNWDTWIECLCRLNRLNDAVRIACTEMGKGDYDVAPDVSTARILVKFARKAGQSAGVLDRVQKHLPEIWDRLPDDFRVP
ncbi:pentatricopeptide repeat-containing protein [Pluteus cervinus]|uniref:Pentatricopeptide repeat-containing protein n=1 Tax=Pluteus cervinus TaxID=181527 RepID=A0ACD3BHI8_9AGAR|nr:pentatricopeptide repeat-containing protein [Pluteus cervinus]